MTTKPHQLEIEIATPQLTSLKGEIRMGETEGKLNMIKTQNLQGEDSTLVMSGYYTTYK